MQSLYNFPSSSLSKVISWKVKSRVNAEKYITKIYIQAYFFSLPFIFFGIFYKDFFNF